MKIIAIIQARMESTRLPGKVMKEICGKPILEHIVSRVKLSKKLDEVIVATSINKADDVIDLWAGRNKVSCFRGSQDNVLERFAKCAEIYNPDIIVRLTADNALIDADIIDKGIEEFLKENNDYIYYKKGLPLGMAVEIFNYCSLKKAYQEADNMECLEHVTPYIYRNPDKFNIKYYDNKDDLSNIRWTIDTVYDYTLVSNIYEKLYFTYGYEFGFDKILKTYLEHEEWNNINSEVEQVKISYNENCI